MLNKRTAPMAGGLALALTLTSCGEGDEEASGLDCSNIEVIVPYSPGGGSDQMVRRLESHLEDSLGTNINVVYREGADGAIAWADLAGSEPDGCTVANIVSPNISLGILAHDDVGYGLEDFTYLGYTEESPHALAVSPDSDIEDLDDFIEAASESPGSMTVAGVPEIGDLSASQIEQSFGVEFSFVPVDGGVGDIVPQLQGGHVDAVVFAVNNMMAFEDSTHVLGIHGTEDSTVLPDVPTFDSLGYEDINVIQRWGFIGPADIPEDIAQEWNEALNAAVEDLEDELLDAGLEPISDSLEESEAWVEEDHTRTEDSLNLLD